MNRTIKLFHLVSFACITILPVNVLAENVPQANEVTKFTKQNNEQLLKELPFNNRQDFKDATRGFIAADDPMLVQNQNGKMVWDLESYKTFIKDNLPAPSTVNPSLWRMAQLNMYHGLFKVTDRIYQVRGYDLSNITFIQGDTGWIVFDPLISAEVAKAALALINKHVGERPVVAVIYSHPHIDHYGGVRGVVDEKDVQAGKIPIIAPEHFLEHAVSENVIAGNAMSRRAMYSYGSMLPRNAKGSVGSGLGITTSAGNSGIIPPTKEIKRTGETIVIDGVEMVFQMTPETEAPVEMNTWFPQFKALWMAENSCNTMYNLLTLRGAEVRDPLKWSKYINEAIELWGKQAEVRFQAHHWPRWGNSKIISELQKQRDLYKYIHDQSVHLMNEGYTGIEIAEKIELPKSLAHVWANRGYYGTLKHNSRAVYQRYLGWYNGNPSDLNGLPPKQVAQKYVAIAGGEKNILKKAHQSYAEGDYRWVAEIVKHVVFANPENKEAKYLLADALEQLGYQAESGMWRNVYLQGAYELRHGTPQIKNNKVNQDAVKAMTPEMLFDYISVRLNHKKAENKKLAINFIFNDDQTKYTLFLDNSVINYTTHLWDKCDVTLKLKRTDLVSLIMNKDYQNAFKQLKKQKQIEIKGNQQAFLQLLNMLDIFPISFPIVTPLN